MRPTNRMALAEDVYSALLHYHQTDQLEQSPGWSWPSSPAGHTIPGLLSQMLSTLAAQADDPPPMSQHNLATTSRQDHRFQPALPSIGLEQLVDPLCQRLHDPLAPALVVIEGLDGRGKTTLARLVAARCASGQAFEGVLWVSARQTESDSWAGQRRAAPPALDLDELLLGLTRELALDLPAGPEQRRAEVQAHCALHRYLIVIDQIEGNTDLAPLLALIRLLHGPSRLLITTGTPLDQLPADLACMYLRLEELDAAQSVRLLRRAAQWADADALAQASEAELAHIYAVVGGNPLALWLVAGQACDRPWQQVLQELAEGRRRGRELYDDLYRQVWRLLSEPARTVLFAMHRCETGAEPELLFALSGLDRPVFDAALNELQRRVLLTHETRYQIHRLTYTFLRVVIAGWLEA